MNKTEVISEALADMEVAVDNLDSALHKLFKVKLDDPEQLDKLNSLREQLNTLLVALEEGYL
jgi:CHASE3 domain sensor protein